MTSVPSHWFFVSPIVLSLYKRDITRFGVSSSLNSKRSPAGGWMLPTLSVFLTVYPSVEKRCRKMTLQTARNDQKNITQDSVYCRENATHVCIYPSTDRPVVSRFSNLTNTCNIWRVYTAVCELQVRVAGHCFTIAETTQTCTNANLSKK